MALEPGTRLGHYEVLSSLGAGGMGEVYRARDTKLGREVAIKTLLDEVSADPERLARFEREARVLASLNHQNVASLYGFESDGDTKFLVMELVEGETLADRFAQGPIPPEDAVPLFMQIAEGLEAAHEQGVIHRDLKPANVKLSPNGLVKILDFGLAKALDTSGVSAVDPSAASVGGRLRLGWPAAIAAVGLIPASGAAVGWLAKGTAPAADDEVRRYTIGLVASEGGRTLQVHDHLLAADPERSALVHTLGLSPESVLNRRDADRLESSPIPGSEGAWGPFHSPNGRWIGFWSFNSAQILRVPSAGGTPSAVAPAKDYWGATWTDRDVTVYAPSNAGGLWAVPAFGGTPTQLTSPEEGDDSQKINVSQGPGDFPRWSRDGSELYFHRGDQLMATNRPREGAAWPSPSPVVEIDFAGGNDYGCDTIPEGRFIAVERVDWSDTVDIVVVENFSLELERALPSD